MQQISLSTQLDNYVRDNMGYCTDYVLTIDYVEEENGKKELAFVPEIILKQLSKTIDDMDIFEDGYGDEWYLYGGKWYEHDTDMLNLSKKFPELLFTLNGHGEETEDMWYSYYYNGKLQHCPAKITYDDFDFEKLKSVQNSLGDDVLLNNK